MEGAFCKYTFSDGRSYMGPFLKGKPHGWNGKGYSSDGRLFHHGQWKNGAAVKRNGKGRLLSSTMR